jgi:intracellular sulfur oxidation DsrE/DsrF family protein
MNGQSQSSSERRSFLTYLNAGVTSLAAMAVGNAAMAQEKPKAPTHWEPTRHDKDDWLELPGKHRLVFDTTSADGLAEALLFANNFMRVNRSDYGLQNSDLAVVIVVRHNSTPFGYNDAIWAKYGTPIAARSGLEDPKSKMPPKANIYNSGDYGELLPNRNVTLDSLFKQGVQLAVCSSATRALAGSIARAVDGNADTINAELIANLVSNARMVPAGIVAVSRAQERGYTLVKT